MRAIRVFFVVALIQSATPTLAGPITTSKVAHRSLFCANAPTTIAGTKFNHRTLVETTSTNLLSPRGANPVVWCTPNSETYIVLSTAQEISETGVIGLLSSAYAEVLEHIQRLGDGTIQTLANGRIYHLQGAYDLALAVFNTNNHQTTWGVLAASILALVDYMAGHGTFCAAAFTIHDGENEVGTGSIGLY